MMSCFQMSKINALLEQETWVSMDAPDEFQAIVDTFTYNDHVNMESLLTEELADTESSANAETMSNEILSAELKGGVFEVQNQILREDSLTPELKKQVSSETLGQLEGPQRTISGDVTAFQPSHQGIDGVANGGDSKVPKVRSSSQTEDGASMDGSSKSKKGRDKPTARTLQIRGVKYHMVNRYVHQQKANLEQVVKSAVS